MPLTVNWVCLSEWQENISSAIKMYFFFIYIAANVALKRRVGAQAPTSQLKALDIIDKGPHLELSL